MKTVFLVILFITNSGTETLKEGWYPREQPDIETCETRASFMEEYMKANEGILPPDIKDFKIFCIEQDQ
jgi:hypothetical protein